MKRISIMLLCLLLCVCLIPARQISAAGEITVHVRIPASWSAAYLYAWDSSDNYVGNAWPGTAMKWDGKWYTLKISSAAANVIVNSNSAPQTQDMALQKGKKEVWIVVGDDNQGTVYYTEPGASTPSQPDVGKKYQVVGSGSIFGKDWEISEDHVMTKKSNGTFTKTYTNVAKGTLGLKVLMNGNVWIPDGMGNETVVQVPEDGSTVTVTFNPKTGKLAVSVAAPVKPDPTDPPVSDPAQTDPTDGPVDEPTDPNPTDVPADQPSATDPSVQTPTDPEPSQPEQNPVQPESDGDGSILWICGMAAAAALGFVIGFVTGRRKK